MILTAADDPTSGGDPTTAADDPTTDATTQYTTLRWNCPFASTLLQMYKVLCKRGLYAIILIILIQILNISLKDSMFERDFAKDVGQFSNLTEIQN